MKIAYFTDSLLATVSGIVASIIASTQGLGGKGHKILILAPKKSGITKNIFKNTNVKMEFLGSLPTFFNPNLRISSPVTPKMYQLIKNFDPDIIHFHTPFLLGAGAIVLGKMLKVPIVSTFHSYFMQPEYLRTVGLKNNKFLSQSLWAYAAWFYTQCQMVIAPTEVVKEDLKKYIDQRLIHVIPTPINEHVARRLNNNSVSALKKKLKLKKHVILYVGRLSAEKSIDILIKAFARALKKKPDSTLFIVGNGPQRKQLTNLVKKLKLGSHVVFAGELSQEILLGHGYFQVADICASASTSETQGISLVEAMYFGLPLVGVAKKGVRELIQNVGLICRPDNIQELADTILKILQDPKLKESLSIKSLEEFKRKYQFKKIITEYERLYRTVIKSGSKGLRR